MNADFGGFYFDSEILPIVDISPLKSADPPRTPLFFPRSHYGDLPSSFSGGTFSSSFDEFQSLVFGSASYTQLAERRSPPEVNESGRIESAQVSQFWNLYNAYPSYLKNVKKRARRKNRKGKAGSAPS
jgi:hypothetical protein